MKPLRVSDGIVPVDEFTADAVHWLNRLARRREPMVLTSKGRPAGVLMSAGAFDRLQERQRFIESVALGLADAEADRTISTRELRRRLAPASPRARKA